MFMGSSSHQRSGSSGSSPQRKRVHLGTGTQSRAAVERPHVQIDSVHLDDRDSKARAKTVNRKSRLQPRVPDQVRVKREARELRMHQERKSRRLRAAAVLGAAGAVVALWVGLYTSSLFEVRDVEVLGTHVLTADAVIQRAAVPERATLLRYGRESM